VSAISRNSCKESHFSKFHSWIFALIVVAVIFFYATSCPAVQITLAWDAYPPSEQVTTYSIYYKTNSPGPPYDGNEASEGPSPIIVPVAELTDPENPQYTVTNLSERERYFFAITATNDYGESAYSNEVSHSPLYFPHVDTNPPWETEIAIINNGSSDLTGTLLAYGNDGQLVESIPVNLAVRGRRQIDVADEFSNPDAIGYFILVTNSTAVRGYTKFYIEGQYRVAVPAVQEVNSGDVYLSHIASDAQWWTGVSILNTTASAKTLTFQFNNGQSRTVDLAAGEHKAFTIASLFGGVAQPTIGSAVIANVAGTVGLELFGSTGAGGESYLSGILLKGDTTSSIYYPHVASD